MSIILIDNKHCFNIANAIRSVKGSNNKIKFSKMADEIRTIPTTEGETKDTSPCRFIAGINNNYAQSRLKLISIPIMERLGD